MLLLSIDWILFAFVREHIMEGAESHFAFCLSVVLAVVIAPIHATAATVRAKQAVIYRIVDWVFVIVAVCILTELFAVPILGHRLFWP
jgi:hypothetical protein